MTCLSSNHIILYSNINRLFTLSIVGASKETRVGMVGGEPC